GAMRQSVAPVLRDEEALTPIEQRVSPVRATSPRVEPVKTKRPPSGFLESRTDTELLAFLQDQLSGRGECADDNIFAAPSGDLHGLAAGATGW
ncbi:MAG: hypothetical protein QOE54_3752, partial [Streptosporangiaceae bacterium]|nr:hypothetical protein [Streptosporangiaceae bacterium]